MRFGFAGAEDYYAKASAGPRLARLGRPALLVEANDDPMILADTVRPTLREEHPLLDVRWMEVGGHVGFPASLDLGLGGELGLEHQIVRWLRRAGSLCRLPRGRRWRRIPCYRPPRACRSPRRSSRPCATRSAPST